MSTDRCTEVELLLQADFDGELDASGAASMASHVEHCPICQARQVALRDLSARLRTELPRPVAPERLRRAVEAAIAATAAAPAPAISTAIRRSWVRISGRWTVSALPFGAGVAMAAVLALFLMLPRDGGGLTDSVIASHIRALQPGHLMDVVSTDQHTVKPWFDGRLDYAPPVKNLAAQGFPLVGGRLDYLAGRPVAGLAYRRAQHVIDLYVWPGSSHIDMAPDGGQRHGYNYVRWTQDEMVFWAVSDLNRAELDDFVRIWRTMP